MRFSLTAIIILFLSACGDSGLILHLKTNGDLSGLESNSSVTQQGVQVGQVETITINPGTEAYITIRFKSAYSVPKGSVFKLTSVDLLGKKAIVMEPAKNDTLLRTGDTVSLQRMKTLSESVDQILDPLKKYLANGSIFDSSATDRHRIIVQVTRNDAIVFNGRRYSSTKELEDTLRATFNRDKNGKIQLQVDDSAHVFTLKRVTEICARNGWRPILKYADAK